MSTFGVPVKRPGGVVSNVLGGGSKSVHVIQGGRKMRSGEFKDEPRGSPTSKDSMRWKPLKERERKENDFEIVVFKFVPCIFLKRISKSCIVQF